VGQFSVGGNNHPTNGLQGMVLRHKIVKATNAEQALGKNIGSAHGAGVLGGVITCY
jgi:hypothetical protein